jgi:hypothetical protein
MLANELKKGDRVKLTSGWFATILDNKKGNIRFAEVEGLVKETGSIYIKDIVACMQRGGVDCHERVELSTAQAKAAAAIKAAGF